MRQPHTRTVASPRHRKDDSDSIPKERAIITAQQPYPAATWYDPRLRARPSPIHGRGLFAAAAIGAGEVVTRVGGVPLRAEAFQAYVATVERYDAIQVDEDLHLVEVAADTAVDAAAGGSHHGMNHSCDAKVWMRDAVTLVAKRDIAPGEEVTVDYALFTANPTWKLEPFCRCGASVCRRSVTGGDWQLAAVRARYRGHFSPFLNARIARSERQATTALVDAESPRSPRIERLRAALAAGKSRALATFWRELAQRGTPLVEPIDGDAEHLLVTFIWRGDATTHTVVVVKGPAGYTFMRNQMARLDETDVWYRTYRVRRDLRTTYELAPNDSLLPIEWDQDVKERTRHWRRDPLNRHRFIFPRDEEVPGDEDFVQSIVELPGAPARPWTQQRPDVPGGAVERHYLRSDLLGNERRVWVYTPPGYTPEGAYGWVLLFDGQAYLDIIPTPITLDNLLAERKLPPLIAVLVDSLGPLRTRELGCEPTFNQFLARELVPWVHDRYAVTREPARTVIGGSSLGGVAAAYAALKLPELFGNVLSQSGAFWWRAGGESEHGWLARQFAASARLPLRFYMDVGLMEVHATPNNGPGLLHANRHLRDVLRAKGYPLTYHEFNGGHDYYVWRGTLGEGLLALVGTED